MSMEMMESKSEARDYTLERLIMLSDGVFAIAMTLLALELRPPEGWNGLAIGELWALMWRPTVAFALSFMVIGIYWMSHRRMFGRFRSADLPLTILNLIVLALITLVPVVTNLLYEVGPRPGPLTLYICLFASIGIGNGLIWGYTAFLAPKLFTEEPTARVKLTVLLILLLVPTMMGVMGLFAWRPGNQWMIVAMLVVGIGVRFLRAHADKPVKAKAPA